jgi:hypothetical protein
VLLVSAVSSAPAHSARASTAIGGLHVVGNQIVNAAGQPVRLLGVNRSGTEYACIQGWGIFSGPSDAASVQAIASWHTTAVRVPLNEDCWLGINGAPAVYSGPTYRQAIANYVTLLNQHGLVAILDLHWNAPGTAQATGQQPVADQDHAPAFWQSVAHRFAGNSSVVFDLYNEPYPDNNQDTTAAWQCWRGGGTCSGVPFRAAGMQQLVNTVRQAGAHNVIMLGGVNYANALSQWLAFEPQDPDHNLVAAWHAYDSNTCNTQACWNSIVAPVLHQVPLVAGEIGESDCAGTFITPLMSWLDSHGGSYLAWAWDLFGCSNLGLISDYGGTPTPYGLAFKNHLASLAQTR